jgi:hypothetical protein
LRTAEEDGAWPRKPETRWRRGPQFVKFGNGCRSSALSVIEPAPGTVSTAWAEQAAP